jgi:hypothetical protein
LVGKPEGKGPLEGPRLTWDDNVEIYLRETGFDVWTGFIWRRIEISGGGFL